MDYSREKITAIEAVAEAARLCRALQADMVRTTSLEKQDNSPVTAADFGAQALICRRLAETFPRDIIVGEEDSSNLRKADSLEHLKLVTKYVRRFRPDATAEAVCQWIDRGSGEVADRFWTVDPIDGTKGFLRHDQYAIALALVEDGQVKVGVLGCPMLPKNLAHPDRHIGVLFVAVRDKGAAMTALDDSILTPIHVAAQGGSQHLRFVESVESTHGNSDLQETIAQTVGITQPPLRLDSQAKYGAVARGDAVLYLRFPSTQSPNYREKIWDHAAGSVIVEEAGGRVTDTLGQALDFASDYRMRNNQGVIASNGELHQAVLRALKNTA